MSSRPMMACSDRLPMLPVVHWMTRSGRSGIDEVMGEDSFVLGWPRHYSPGVHPCGRGTPMACSHVGSVRCSAVVKSQVAVGTSAWPAGGMIAGMIVDSQNQPPGTPTTVDVTA